MARTNLKQELTHITHEGAPARRISKLQELRRSVMACMLWERAFYESGEDIATRIHSLVRQVSVTDAASIAVEARHAYRMRHAPLWVCVAMLNHHRGAGAVIGNTIADVISRADEPGELLSLFFGSSDRKQSGKKLPYQLRRGIAKAFNKFDEYQLAKYDRTKDGFSLRDAMMLCRPKPRDEQRADLWNRFTDRKLSAPNTWEVGLSSGGDKKETFERLLSEQKLGYMALLRNLRNMEESGVSRALVETELYRGAEKSKALPFRFISAARAAPSYERVLDECMMSALRGMPKMDGNTNILVDVSGSMTWGVSAKSDLKLIDAACALAVIVEGICSDAHVYSFSDNLVRVPPRSGMALIDAIKNSQFNSGTQLGHAIRKTDDGSRLIVVTDEQSYDPIPNAKGVGYMLNVGTNKNGVGYGDSWVNISGFSEASVRFIQELESQS